MTKYKLNKYGHQIEDWINILAEVDKLEGDDVNEYFLDDFIEDIINESNEEYMLRITKNILAYCERQEYYNYCISLLELKNNIENEINKTIER